VTTGGEYRSRRRASSPDFADYRPYQHGDDIRRIDWNVYARLGDLQIRLTEAQLRLPVTILLDCSASMNWGDPNKFQFGRDLATALGRVALARTNPLEIHQLGGDRRTLGPINGVRQFGHVELRLSEARTAGQVDVLEAVHRALAERNRARASDRLVVLISDLCHVTDHRQLFQALREVSASPVVVHIVSPEESEPEALGDVDFIDAESGRVVEVGLSLETVRRYRERFTAWLMGIEGSCTELGVRYARCSTDRSVIEIMLADLRTSRILQ
jgi:uncharacterized protein (DUF58 family)